MATSGLVALFDMLRVILQLTRFSSRYARGKGGKELNSKGLAMDCNHYLTFGGGCKSGGSVSFTRQRQIEPRNPIPSTIIEVHHIIQRSGAGPFLDQILVELLASAGFLVFGLSLVQFSYGKK